ncbi:MAG: Clp protease N-terminal domain-containing protein [Planctomycetota bacterium]|jgi:ATP-dependent Clp protease ATP-binding subunit ClpC
MFERFTDRARKVMATANEEVQRFGHEYMGTEHILLGLIKESEGKGASILKARGVDIEKMLGEIEQLAALRGKSKPLEEDQAERTPEAIEVIKYAVEEAAELGSDHIGTEHILLGLLRESEGAAGSALTNLGVRLDDVRDALVKQG